MADTRTKKTLGLRIDRALLERLESWRAAQDVPPAKIAVVETALKEFLDRREQPQKARGKR